jgi:hypothetical protein
LRAVTIRRVRHAESRLDTLCIARSVQEVLGERDLDLVARRPCTDRAWIHHVDTLADGFLRRNAARSAANRLVNRPNADALGRRPGR